MRFPATLLALALSSLAILAQEVPTAASVTAPGRSFERALDVVLGSGEAGRILLFVVDPTPELEAARFPALLAEALDRNRGALEDVEFGLARIGDKRLIALPPTPKADALVLAVQEALSASSGEIQNLYAPLRRLAQFLEARSAPVELILVSLENGDAEDELEGTVAALQRAGIRVTVITREAYLADPFWADRSGRGLRGASMSGADGPFIDLPWGWLLQPVEAGEITPSGFALYGLGRLAAATGGRVFLHAATDASRHRCWSSRTTCPFCSGDHVVPGEVYRAGSMAHFAPLLAARRDAYKAAATDPYWRAVLRAWQQAERAGLVRSRPSLKPAGGGYAVEPRQSGQHSLFSGSLGFARLSAQALKLTKECARIASELEQEMERAASSAYSPRYRAMADLTLILLHLTRINLFAFEAWCAEVAPRLSGKERLDSKPPEMPMYTSGGKHMGIHVTGFSLCHGVAPFLQLGLPGGDEWRSKLGELDARVAAFLERYQGTPYALALRHSAIAYFQLTFPGRPGGVPRDRLASRSAEAPGTGTERPRRIAAPGTGPGAAGPTTGGR